MDFYGGKMNNRNLLENMRTREVRIDMNNYVCYHLHTEQSLLDSCTNYKEYVDKCVQLKQNAIAFTEHG